MSLFDKLNYSEQEKQAINSYYEKLNKSKSKLTDDIPKEPKDEDIIDFSDENLKEASDNLLKIIKDNEVKKFLDLD